MRKTKRFVTILLMTILLGGCGNSGVSQEEYDKVVAERDALKNESQESDNSTASANESEEIPDLSGNWEQEGKGESYQAGYISDDVIEIYWITDDSKALYWSGSYEAPTVKTDSFSWESKSDKEKTSTALLASLDDSKIFTYDSGKISYEVTVQGVTQTIKMIPTDTDYSDNQTKASGDDKEQTEGKAQLAIPESATNGMWVNSYVDIQQKDGKYETRIYLDSVDAADAELIFFAASVAMSVIDKGIESDFYVVFSDNEYKLNMESQEISDSGFPEEWTEFLVGSDDEGEALLTSISVSFSNSLDNWSKYSFAKYLDDVIIVEEESETEERKETGNNENIVYSDQNVIITYTGIKEKSYGNGYLINFTIENLSEKTLTIQLRETSINGIMVNPMCSIDIASGKKAINNAEIWGDDAKSIPMSEVKNIETKFHIFNDSDWSDRYDTENIVILNIE